MQTLGEELPKEMERVRKLIVMYNHPDLMGAGVFASTMMEQSLKKADIAVMSGDISAMILAYQDLQGYTE